MAKTTVVDTRDITASVHAQAKVRIFVGFPVLLLALIAIWYWGTPYSANMTHAVVTIATVDAIYIAVAFFLASRIEQDISAHYLAISTAIIDPLIMSAGLVLMNEFGAFFVCFYLFTILGFGFRIGRGAMVICQITSLVCFAAVLAIVPAWHEHLIFGFAFFIMLAVIPLYATTLIKALRDAQSRAEFDSQAKTQLLAKVSHELRTPLTGIVSSAELIAAEAPNAHITKRAEIILGLSNDLILEINDLLDSAKFAAKALVLESSSVDLGSVMEQVRLTFEATAATKNIEYVVTIDPQIKCQVQCDARQLSRVLKNLVGNAVKFTDQGKVEANLKLLGNDSDSYRLLFTVQDTGIGIPAEVQQKIFDPFFQASAGTARQYGGTGLGMSLAKDIVTLMGGEIAVRSEPGSGSLFYFDIKLPIVPHSSTKPSTPVHALPASGKCVLVADDNSTNLILIQELLEADRHVVLVAHSGEEALRLLSSRVFDIVFLDYNMRDINGNDVLRLYRFGRINTVPVFFITADATSATATKLLESGAAGVLYKPIARDSLRQAITQICDNSESPAQMKYAPLASNTEGVSLKFVPPQYLDLSIIENLQTFSQRPGFFYEVLTSAIVDIDHNSNRLLKALVVQNIEEIHDAAHALSSVSESVGAVRLAVLARKLMRIDRWKLKTGIEHWKQEIEEATHQSTSCLRDLLSEQKAMCQ